MGLSANRPLVIDFEEESCSEDVASHWHVGSCWETITEEEFMANEAANEYVVDDSDADFELVDANKTMIQHYFPPKHSYRTLQGGHTNCWKDSREIPSAEPGLLVVVTENPQQPGEQHCLRGITMCRCLSIKV